MSTELSVQDVTREKIELWKRTFCKGASDDELALFVSVAKRTGLSPEARQIYLVPRYSSSEKRMVMTPQTSIDGFRVIAEKSGKYAGQLGPFYTDDGKWTEFWFKNTPPKAAKIAVLRHDFKEPLWAVAHWDSYVQKDKDGKTTFIWSKMGELMLAKCAESLALRKAFPQEMSGLYTEEEMSQAIEVEAVESKQKHQEPRIFTSNDPKKLLWLEKVLELENIAQDMKLKVVEYMEGKNIDTELSPYLKKIKNGEI